jgi:hypothetical protein
MPPRVGSVFFHGLRIKVILPVGWSALKALCFCEVYGREWFSLLFDIWGVIWVIWEMCILQKLLGGDSVSHYLTTPLVHWIRGTKVIICQPLECQKARILDLHSPLHLNMEVALMQSVIPVKSGSTKGEHYSPCQPGQKVMPYLPNNQSKKGLELWIK